jgi:signal transduction histidine kinase/purine-cytosine permease-like protein/DNA-binding NarL/FixJ family response regulator
MHPSAPAPPAQPSPTPPPQQRVVKVRRDYNAWVARETMEDYALRFTPRAFRRWSEWRVANTAFGASSFLVLEAVGATLLLQFGFINAFWAVLATGAIIFAAGLPISIYAARYGLDMDLLTRGAGFGYLGSTLTSLIYASFTFIFFALEAAIMAYALELAFGLPPAWGYLASALVVIPLVTHGVTVISRLQVWTQPLWLVLMVVPYFYVFNAHPTLVHDLRQYAGLDAVPGAAGQAGGFDPLKFGAALTVGIALFTQMGEQVDYLRFMPEKTHANRWRWWFGVVAGGPGWVVPGVLKMLGGMLLAYLALKLAVPADRVVDPNQMYLAAYEIVFPHYGWAVGATALLVIVSQLKINVTNAYAGSLAWSNFFARLTHSHPGRVVWVVFNILIALMLMELEVFQAIGGVLGLFSNIAISWLMAVVADLVINKPLGLSPQGIEFKRAHLVDINPVGVGAMGLASVLSIAAHLGAFGPWPQAFSALIAMAVALVASPLIAWATRGRYYLARRADTGGGAYLGTRLAARTCTLCSRPYEGEDMAHCPAYGGPICSLCCSLDARCHDLCKPESARASFQVRAVLRRLVPRAWWPQLDTGLGRYLLLMAVVAPALAGLLGGLLMLELRAAAEAGPAQLQALAPALKLGFLKAYAALLLVGGVIAWWLVLTQHSRRVAQEESNRQTEALVLEIDSHRRTDEQLQRARLDAEAALRAAEAANQAKTRYVSAISHELRTPLNSILGYAQLLDEDPATPAHRRQAVGVIRRGGEHLLRVIEGTLDIARIEAGRLTLDSRPVRLRELLGQIVQMFELQAASRGLSFSHDIASAPPVVRADERRLTQILINVLGNAVKFTAQGRVSLRLKYQRDMAVFEVQDSGPGIAADELDRIFEPFARGGAAAAEPQPGAPGGTGLGLTIARMLTDLMGGEMTVSSRTQAGTAGPDPAAGTLFRIRLFLPELDAARAPLPGAVRAAVAGPQRRVLVVDNEEVDRSLLADRLQALGFEVLQAASGHAALALLHEWAVDAILLDLAMPGIDGWETLRTLQREGLSSAPVAIVSANAFDKGLDNDLGITAADFITKPVHFDELLDWLGRRLGLQWLAQAPRVSPVSTSAQASTPGHAPLAPPPAHHQQALSDLVRLGYVRGVLARLDEIEAEHPECAAWLATARGWAQAFQLDRITPLLQTPSAEAESPAASHPATLPAAP